MIIINDLFRKKIANQLLFEMQWIVSDWVLTPSIDFSKWWRPELGDEYSMTLSVGIWICVRVYFWFYVRICVWACVWAWVRPGVWVQDFVWVSVPVRGNEYVNIVQKSVRVCIWIRVRVATAVSIHIWCHVWVWCLDSIGIRVRVEYGLVSKLIFVSTQLWWRYLRFRYHLIGLEQRFSGESFSMRCFIFRGHLLENHPKYILKLLFNRFYSIVICFDFFLGFGQFFTECISVKYLNYKLV